MYIERFGREHISDARAIARKNYEAERKEAPGLPDIDVPELDVFADNGLGVALMDEEDGMLGFLCAGEPEEDFMGSGAKGVFSPIYAHGVRVDDHAGIYRRLYSAAAEVWLDAGADYHSLSLYAHDMDAAMGLFTCGFAMRRMDAVRPAAAGEIPPMSGVTYRRLEKDELPLVDPMRDALGGHIRTSPCFAGGSYHRALTDAERDVDGDVYAAFFGDACAAYVKTAFSGDFPFSDRGLANIRGAFCREEFRGSGLMTALLNYTVGRVAAGGGSAVGVSFDSANLHAYGFWMKYFYACARTLARRVDRPGS